MAKSQLTKSGRGRASTAALEPSRQSLDQVLGVIEVSSQSDPLDRLLTVHTKPFYETREPPEACARSQGWIMRKTGVCRASRSQASQSTWTPSHVKCRLTVCTATLRDTPTTGGMRGGTSTKYAKNKVRLETLL